MSDEDKSTHDMVIGLHRRFDVLETDVKSLTLDARDNREKLIKMEGRVDVTEVKASAAAEREAITFGHVMEAMGKMEKSLAGAVTALQSHAAEEAPVLRKIILWLMGIAGTIVTGVVLMLIGRGV